MMIKNRIVAFVLFMVIWVLFWNLLDFLYSKFITGNAFQFAAAPDLGIPLAVAVVTGYFLFLRKDK